MQAAIKRGEDLLAEGKIDDAEKCFLEVVNQQPESRAYNNLGVIAFHRKDAQQASERFMKAVELDPTNIDAVVNLCSLLESVGSLGEVADLLQTLSEKFPDNREVAKWLAKARTGIPVSAAPPAEVDILTKRVLHGSYEIANQMNTMTAGLKQLGMHAETLCYYPTYMKHESDHVLDIEKLSDANEAIQQTRQFAEKLIPQFDIFHFHFGTTLTIDYSDLPVLQKLGKKMLMHYWGSDARMLSRAIEMNQYVKVKVANEELIKKRLEIVSAHMSHCIVTDWELNEYVKDFFEHVHVLPVSMNLEKYHPQEKKPDKNRFLIVHAPTAPEIKGTPHIVKAIEELQPDHNFEFKLVQGMAHEEARKIYEQADLIIDQIRVGVHGLLAVENMAMGKPVITWISDFMTEKYPPELPLIRANPDTIKEQIEWALNNRDALAEIGCNGRKYVEKYHDMNKNAHQVVEIYRSLYR
ncbi:MAG: glycosyltransferase family 1 protein [candidate division Zixibacteria bacterium]|nr:glycosyltransferase family 1 protein [candidate division Zixibacteria bacterium]